MCEFCDKYGDGDIWYLNPSSYGRQLYRRKLPGEGKFVPEAIAYRKKRQEFFDVFLKALNEKDKPAIDEYRDKINELYRTNEPCQVIPLQDAYKMVDLSFPVAIMSCICQSTSTASFWSRGVISRFALAMVRWVASSRWSISSMAAVRAK